MWIEIVCNIVLAGIAVWQTQMRHKTSAALLDSTALLSATVSAIDLDDESKRTFMEQIEENKRWI